MSKYSISTIINRLSQTIFKKRGLMLLIFGVITVALIASATQIKIGAGFTKMVPMNHDYIKTFMKHRHSFGGADRIMVALVEKRDDKDMFNPEFFEALKKVTDEVFYIKGVDRSRVKSLVTPNVTFIEVVEGGFSGGQVIPYGFVANAASFETVRKNIYKSGQYGRLVSNDFKSAMVTAELTELDPDSGERLDYLKVAKQLEINIREKFEREDLGIHIIGFAKLIGEITDNTKNVLLFFLITFLFTFCLLYLSTHSLKLTSLPLLCAFLAVSWQLGLIPLSGLTMDPMSIVVTFLVFAIAISHSIQMVNSTRLELLAGATSLEAAQTSFRRLFLPGMVALASDGVGFLTILWIKIDVVREMALSACLGLAAILVINLILLPILLSYIQLPKSHAIEDHRRHGIRGILRNIWSFFEHFTHKPKALLTLLITLVVVLIGLVIARDLHIGDVQPGSPELHGHARYNQDVAQIVNRYSLGLDVITIFGETEPDGGTQYDILFEVDLLHKYLEQLPGVHAVISLPQIAKQVFLNWNETYPKWYGLPRNQQQLLLAINPLGPDTGLVNFDGSAVPIYIFTTDHKAETISTIINEFNAYMASKDIKNINFTLAGGNVGIMAATNETVDAAQIPMLIYLYLAIFILCLLFFRSWRAVICIGTPLIVISVLTYTLMVLVGIGLKVATLPVVALGAGIGVDYAIYVYSRLRVFLKQGDTLLVAYQKTLRATGNAVFFTGLTLGAGVGIWIFSGLKFQADMGVLLTFMFIGNMIAALVLLPAIASFIFKRCGTTEVKC